MNLDYNKAKAWTDAVADILVRASLPVTGVAVRPDDGAVKIITTVGEVELPPGTCFDASPEAVLREVEIAWPGLVRATLTERYPDVDLDAIDATWVSAQVDAVETALREGRSDDAAAGIERLRDITLHETVDPDWLLPALQRLTPLLTSSWGAEASDDVEGLPDPADVINVRDRMYADGTLRAATADEILDHVYGAFEAYCADVERRTDATAASFLSFYFIYGWHQEEGRVECVLVPQALVDHHMNTDQRGRLAAIVRATATETKAQAVVQVCEAWAARPDPSDFDEAGNIREGRMPRERADRYEVVFAHVRSIDPPVHAVFTGKIVDRKVIDRTPRNAPEPGPDGGVFANLIGPDVEDA